MNSRHDDNISRSFAAAEWPRTLPARSAVESALGSTTEMMARGTVAARHAALAAGFGLNHSWNSSAAARSAVNAPLHEQNRTLRRRVSQLERENFELRASVRHHHSEDVEAFGCYCGCGD